MTSHRDHTGPPPDDAPQDRDTTSTTTTVDPVAADDDRGPRAAPEVRSAGGLMRSSAAVAVGTGLSRLSGLVRTVVLAYALGTGALADAYNLANNTPNMVYDLVLGGVLAATLVPVVVEHMDRRDQRGIDALVTVVTVALVAMTALAMLLAPVIIRLYGLTDTPEARATQAEVAVPLLVLFLPQILFYGLTSLGTALLNARRSFAIPAFAPVLNNAVVICLFLALPRVAGGEQPTFDQVRDDPALLWLLGLGTTAGIAAMTLVLWPAMRRAGIRLHWRFEPRHPAVRQVARLSGWTFGYVGASQAAFFAITTLANGVDGVSVYAYAWIFFQLLYGLWSVSVMTAYMPELATAAVRGDMAGLRSRFTSGFRLVQVVILPGAVAMALLAGPVVELALQRGNFGATSAAATADTLAAFSVGLPFFAAYLYTMRGFYALRNTRTPFWINLGQATLQVGLAVVLVDRWGVAGLAAALSTSYVVWSVVAISLYESRVGRLATRPTVVGLAKIAAGTVVLGLVIAGVVAVAGDEPLWAVVAGLAGVGAYGLVLWLLRAEELTMALGPVRRLLGR